MREPDALQFEQPGVMAKQVMDPLVHRVHLKSIKWTQMQREIFYSKQTSK